MSDLTSETLIIPFSDPTGLETIGPDADSGVGRDPHDAYADRPDAVALDVGTETIRSLRVTGDRTFRRRQASEYTLVPAGSAQRTMLTAAGMKAADCGDRLLVAGNSAYAVARSFETPLIPSLPEGRLPDSDPVGRQVAALLVESVLPDGEGVCGLSLPAGTPPDSPLESFVANLVQLRGYRPLLVSPAVAAGVGLLDGQGLTGLCIDVGASGVDITMIVRGGEVSRECVTVGGRHLLERVAESGRRIFHDREGHRYRDTADVRDWLRSPRRDLAKPTTPEDSRLAVDIQALLAEIATRGGRLLATCGLSPNGMPIVVTGGLLRVRGFDKLLRSAFADVDLATTEILTCGDEDGLAVCRGLLSLAEAEVRPWRAAA